MKNLYSTRVILILFAFLFSITTNAQGQLWTSVLEQDIAASGTRIIKPNEYKTAQLNLQELDNLLFTAPTEIIGQTVFSDVVLPLPDPDGGISEFKVYYSPIMEQGLADQYPEIRTYGGYDADGNYVRLDHTPQGFHAMVIPRNGDTWFIDPYTFGTIDPEYYVVYKRKDHSRALEEFFDCQTVSDSILDRDDIFGNEARYADCQHREYRLAISATAEYTTFHGGSVALAQAAQVTTMNRVNGVFEQELAIRMTFIANNNLIIYTNAGSDPFTNGNPGAMINENQTSTDAAIGAANYDIGHVFGTNSGGLAQLYSPCSGNKARGVTGSGSPIGDSFDIDYVAHEMGHQFGAQHTQNNDCNRSTTTSMEPGSASTIMGYAGICAPNVQNNSDDYFHAISLQEMGNFITGGGHTCPNTTGLANSAPTVTGTPGDITIPASTPFALTATAADADGDPILYCWEQMDPTWATMPPLATNTDGPNFRSLDPSLSPTRYFPNLPVLATGVTPTWEVLSSVGRVMPFRVSIRDYAVGGGCTDHVDINVTIDNSTGPFVVTIPSNTGITWAGNTNESVTWNVAGTNGGAVSCGNVDIFLSTDGGLTYPTQLADNVSNDGSEIILVPNTASTTARIMVMCEDGTFFDISDNDFTITAATFDYTLGVTSNSASACQPSNATYTVNVGSIGGYSDPVSLSVSGVPAGATATFGTNPITPGNNTTLTISNTGSATPGVYALVLQGTSTSGTKTENLTLTINTGTPSATTNSTPANGANNVAIPTTLSWGASASNPVTYTVDVATDAGFTSIVQTTSNITGTSLVLTGLGTSTTYYWRVRVDNACASSAYSTTFSFTTNSCGTTASTDVPVTISASGTPTVTSTLNIGVSGLITDLNLLNLNIPHSYVSDLTITLQSPQGTIVSIMAGLCGGNNNIDLNFDDSGTAYASIPCPPIGGGTYQANQALSAFNGEDPLGTWTLTVSDAFNADGGSIDDWSLEICSITNDYTLSTSPTTASECAGTDAAYTVSVSSVGGYSDPVTLSVTGLPAGAIATFGSNPVTPGNNTTLTISNTAGVTPGNHTFTLNATSTSGNQAENLTLEVITASPGQVTLLNPSNAATGVSTSPTLAWSASATSGVTYTVQVALEPTFSAPQTTTGIAGTSLNLTGLLVSTAYYWRVQTVSACGSSAYTSAYLFTTGTCVSYASTDVPINIPVSGTPTVTSTVTVSNSGTITDINIIDLDILHTWGNDLTISLQSPAGTSVMLINQICGNDDNFFLNLDDAGAAHGTIPCPSIGGGTYQPDSPLSAFNGEDPAGVWTLTVTDNVSQDGGSIEGWTLEVCADPPCPSPTLPTLSFDTDPICPGGLTTNLNISGTLNSATAWHIYSTACGTGAVGNTATGTFAVSPTSTTTYYVRGEGNCVSPASCASATLTVDDSTNPTISCPSNTSENANGSCQVSLPDYTGAATVSDNCDASPGVSQSPAATTLIAAVGTVQTVTLTVTDASSNTADCTFDVTIVDNAGPVVDCSSITVINPSATCGMPDLTGSASVSDNCDGSPTIISQSPAAATNMSTLVGTNQTLTITAVDATGTTGNCSIVLPVVDNTAPTITCPSNTTENANGACAVALPNYTSAAVISDGCDAAPIISSQSPGAGALISGVGTVQTVTLTVSDASSNTANCTFDVTIVDTTDPTITCPGNVSVTANATTCTASPALGSATTGDNCSVASTVNNAPANFNVGNTTVTWTVTDGSGNTNTCTQQVTVSDNTPAQPGTISGTAVVCSGDNETYSISAVTGATGYTWNLPSDWTGSSTTNSISVVTGSNAGNISVTADNACGSSTAQTLAVSHNTSPSQPGTISGNSTACPSSTEIYSIAAVAGAISYQWTLPSGWVGISSTTSISTTVGSNSGTISVTAVGTCGNSIAQTLAVNPASPPAQPSAISGLSPACPTSSQTYSVPAVVGAVSYSWTLPSGWTGTSTTNSISVNTTATGGTISVAAVDACGQTGVARTLAISIISIDDGIPCTVDACNPANGTVTHTADNAICDDGLWCNGTETCDPILGCQPGTAPILDDGNGCTDDSCEEILDQVVHSFNTSPCDDGDPFTINDQCFNGVCNGTPTNVWTGNLNTTWGVPGNWSLFIPSSTDDATIPTSPVGGVFPQIPSGYIAEVDNIEVQSGAVVNVLSGGTLNVFGQLTNNGTVNVNDSGSLLQQTGSTIAGTGTYNVQRLGSIGQKFNFWSSPITNRTSVPGTSYRYNSNTGTQTDADDTPSDPGWVAYNGLMVPGTGYSGMGAGLTTFSGIVNNGPINKALDYYAFDNTYSQTAPGTPFNLVGNPYPSAISAASLIADNTDIDGTLYFWDDDNSAGSDYHRSDFAYWNGTGGLGTGAGSVGAPNGFISTAQGFYVRALNGASVLNFTNAQRVPTSNSQFFRMNGDDSRLWFSIEKDSAFNQILIGMLTDATFGEDRLYDAVKMHSVNRVSLAAMANAREHAIMAFPPLTESYTVPLLINVTEPGSYTFKANTIENFEGYLVYFNDVLSNTDIQLHEGTSINTFLQSGEYSDRFFLNFHPATVTGLDDSPNQAITSYISNDQLHLKVTGSKDFSASIELMDMSGRLVFAAAEIFIEDGRSVIPVSSLSNGAYSLRLTSVDKVYSEILIKN